MSSPFTSLPETEASLFQQAIARLEEVRVALEDGPFSERGLLPKNVPEKQLQLWLAEKFRLTQNARFSVHREEEADDDKKTDIQLSALTHNVCVEIKPVDADRAYSANSLTKTLQEQVVDQYLRGYNSSRGILVLFQLDAKTWEIPGVKRDGSFSELLAYLSEQANRIKRENPGVEELIVFGMSCLPKA